MSDKFTVSATGHRPPVLFKENPYSKEHKRLLTNFAKEELKKLINLEKIEIIMGCAQGWDSAVGFGAYELDIPYIAAVPFDGMHTKWPKDSQKEFEFLLRKAKEVVYVCEAGYANWKFYERDKWMVDRANDILALYNGTTDKHSGTRITVEYAQSINKPIINTWEEWMKYSECASSL
jgi:uncharacterized phage-like protein YoqJ